jgi:hypothetical protein
MKSRAQNESDLLRIAKSLSREETSCLVETFAEISALYRLEIMGRLSLDQHQQVGRWIWTYNEGLKLGRCRDDAQILRRLATLQLMSDQGSTQGKRYKMSTAGIWLASFLSGDDVASIWKLFEMLRDRLERAAHEVSGRPILYGYEILSESAGPQWSRALQTDATWEKYIADLSDLHFDLLPLCVAGWIGVYRDTVSPVWAVCMTDAGLEAVDLVTQEPPADLDLIYFKMTAGEYEEYIRANRAAWTKGNDRGMERFIREQPPQGSENIITRRITLNEKKREPNPERDLPKIVGKKKRRRGKVRA